MSRAAQAGLGVVIFLAGGAVLAFAGDSVGGVALGTTAGLAGLGLMAWAWLGQTDRGDD